MDVEGNIFTLNPERDYFRGVPTILNSEKAAIAQAHKLFSSIQGKHFLDKDFGPKDENDFDGNRFSIYINGEAPTGY